MKGYQFESKVGTWKEMEGGNLGGIEGRKGKEEVIISYISIENAYRKRKYSRHVLCAFQYWKNIITLKERENPAKENW